jgi:hypothetical protein
MNVFVVCLVSDSSCSKEPRIEYQAVFSSMRQAEEYVRQEDDWPLETDERGWQEDAFYRIYVEHIKAGGY